MTEQLGMFEDEDYYKQELKLKEELTQAQEDYLLMKYADELFERKGYGHKVDNKWHYTEDRYKLLHYLLQFADGKKKSISGWELANYMFNIKNTEKLRGMIRALRRDNNVDVVIGSWQGGYFIAKQNELYDAVKYAFGKAVDLMITTIHMFPALYESFIKIAQVTYQHTDKASDKQITALFENDTQEIIDMVIRYADTLKKESKK